MVVEAAVYGIAPRGYFETNLTLPHDKDSEIYYPDDRKEVAERCFAYDRSHHA